jgi:hypothetical protein
LVINGKTIPAQYRQNKFLKITSWVGIVYLIGFSLYFLWISSF